MVRLRVMRGASGGDGAREVRSCWMCAHGLRRNVAVVKYKEHGGQLGYHIGFGHRLVG